MPDFSNFTPCPKPDKKIKPAYKGISRQRKITGEKDLFLKIWNERPHVSEISGDPLGEEPHVQFFIHALGKGAAKIFRLREDNIFLGTFDEHYLYDFGSIEQMQEHPAWEGFKKVLNKKEELKIEQYKPQPTI